MTDYPQTLIDAKERHTRAKEAYFAHENDGSIDSDIQGDILNREMCTAYEVYHVALGRFLREQAASHDKNIIRDPFLEADAEEIAEETAHG